MTTATALKRLMAALVILIVSAVAVTAQMAPAADRPIDAALQEDIIDSVTTTLNNFYVFPDVARKMDEVVRTNLRKGVYKDLTSLSAFHERLQTDMFAICQDRHFSISFISDEEIRESSEELPEKEREAFRDRELRRAAYANFGFRKVEILDGNIGYLKLNGFSGWEEAAPVARATMAYLANCNALIIDLRQNGGGSPAMIQILSTYLFDEKVHLNSFYDRRQDSIAQFWTSSFCDGKRMAHQPIYILTAGGTFSAAEEFTYNLKNLQRAIIVGDTTGGGAHPVEEHFFANNNTRVIVPWGRAINPITGTNWEGTGIPPHVACEADAALEVAVVMALDTLQVMETDPELKQRLSWAAEMRKALLNPFGIGSVESLLGEYGPRRLFAENGSVYYQREGRPKMKATPMTPTLFCFEDAPYFRLEVVTDATGRGTRLIGHYDNGHSDSNDRTR